MMVMMRLKNPVGTEVRMGDSRWHIVGEIKDFILESPYSAVAPMLMVGPSSLSFYVLNMKFNPSRSVSDNLKKAELIFKKYNPSYPFEYYFLDEDYAGKFANEKQTGRLAALFARAWVWRDTGRRNGAGQNGASAGPRARCQANVNRAGPPVPGRLSLLAGLQLGS